jgi:hypothetical protein
VTIIRRNAAYNELMTVSKKSLPLHIVERLRQLSAPLPRTDDENPPSPKLWARTTAAAVLATLGPAAPSALAIVFIAPAYDGGVTLEWGTDDDRQLIVSIPPEEGCRFSIFRYSVSPRFEEDLSVDDLDDLPGLLAWLTDGDGKRGRQLVNVAHEEARWDERLSAAADTLARLAERALADERTGRTALLDLDKR